MALNGLESERTLPVNRPLRIPLEWLVAAYVKPTQQRAPPALATLEAPPPAQPPVAPPTPDAKAKFRVKSRPLPLEGPPAPAKKAGKASPQAADAKRQPTGAPWHVILDPGHGGEDPGAVYLQKGNPPLYEHEVVYDIALRAEALLENHGITAHLTLHDPAQRHPLKRLNMAYLGQERIRVTPPYRMDSAKVAVNMRVYLIDTLYRRLQARGVPAERILLISIHGDALAADLQGAMVYYPDKRLRSAEFGPRGRVYRLRSEAVPTTIRYKRSEHARSETRSQRFGQLMLDAFSARGLGVGRRALRGYFYREGERTLPAVLRYSRVPTSILLEVANLNHPGDRQRIAGAGYRQRIAEAMLLAVRLLQREASEVGLIRPAEGQLLAAQGR